MDTTANIYRSLKSQATLLRTVSEYRRWRDECEDSLKLITDYMNVKRNELSVGAKRRLTTVFCRLRTLCVLLQRRFSRLGSGTSTLSASSSSLVWENIESAFRNRVMSGAVINTKHIDPQHFLKDARRMVINRVSDVINEHSCVKVNVQLEAEFILREQVSVKSFNTRNCELYASSNLRRWYSLNVVRPITVAMEEFQERDSGWALIRILHLIVNCNKFQPISVGCTVAVPQAVQSKKAIVNIKCDNNNNDDDTCFFWAVVAGLYEASGNVSRASSYPHYSDTLCTDGIQLPMTMKQIRKFEKRNNVSINVFVWEDNACLPFHCTEKKRDRHVNLLMLENGKDHPARNHFVCIKNLSRLVSSQASGKKNAKYICDRCLHYFASQDKLDKHTVDCRRLNECAVILPADEERWLQFKNHAFKERVPFVIYADLECLLEDVSPEEQGRERSAYQHHGAFNVGYYVSCAYDKSLSYYRSYRSETDCVKWFAMELYELGVRLKGIFDRVAPMKPLSQAHFLSYRQATACHICEKPFDVDDVRVRDHCHFTGEYRGAAHDSCNLNYQDSYVVPIVFHNLSGYDAHFIVKEIATAFPGKIDLLPLTKENYISFTKHLQCSGARTQKNVKFRFIDSLKFLDSSLDKLSSYLSKDKLRILRDEYKHLSDTDLNLLTRKGVFPYDYLTSYEKLSETSLPARDMFYNRLCDRHVSEADYQHALNVWSNFRIDTLGQYSDLYLHVDVLLLADVFENFRDDCIANYNLDPAHYYTLPGFTWDAMMKHTKIELELLTDIDMLLFVERGIRGGLSQCSNRYARANNKYLPSYDPSKASKYLMYFDVNNLYGWAMFQPLPYGGFRWLDDGEVAEFDVNSVSEDASTGYTLEVDLEYPREIHDAHADLPFCPSHSEKPQKKLLATVHDKERYVIHYRYLQQCLKHGLKLTKVHRVLQFQQSKWLRSYIDFNTRLRAHATNDFSKNLFKLMNNAVFGKTMENVRNHVDVKLVTRWDGRYGAEALISKPNFHSRSIFDENLIAIELRKLQVKFQKPIYIGACILDISKTCLYSFHYDYMLPKFRDQCKLLYTDTDSLIYAVECDDMYEIMRRDIVKFDTSDYADDNPYGIPRANKKVPGLMKDENNGSVMTEFVGLRAKVYATRVHGARESVRKAKGIRRSVTADHIQFQDYIDCLNDRTEKTVRQNRIKSVLHTVYSISEQKLALSPHDDKRFILPNSTDTLPWGHYRINK